MDDKARAHPLSMTLPPWTYLALYWAVIVMFWSMASVTLEAGPAGWATGGAYLAGVLLVQVLFVFGAGATDLCDPIPSSRLWIPVLVASFILGLEAGGLFLAIDEAAWAYTGYTHQWSAWAALATLCACFLVVWMVSGLVLWRWVRRLPRMRALFRLALAILICSSGTMVVAIACLEYATSRPGPAWRAGQGPAIAVNIGFTASILGVGLIAWLKCFSSRYERQKAPACAKCGYDLRGSIPAGSTTCPECGAAIPEAMRRGPAESGA